MPADKSIVVLPFVNRSSDPEDEFFSDGITEELIHALSRVPKLKVIARTSSFVFKNQTVDVREIADRLGVSNVLEGSIRRAGARVRISAQLVQAEDRSQLWSGHFDRQMADIFALQDEISLLIVDSIREELGHLEVNEHLVRPPAKELDSYLLLLKANYHFNQWNPEDVRQAMTLFEQLLVREPEHVGACLGLADGYGFMATTQFLPPVEAWSKAKAYINKAYELDPEEAGVHYQLSQLAFFVDCDFKASSGHTRRALQLRPNHPEAQQFMAFLYMLCGAMTKAKEHLEIALTFDPLNQETLFFRAYYAYRTNDYPLALSRLAEILAQNDKNIPALSLRLYALLADKQYEALAIALEDMPAEVAVPDEILGLRCLLHIGQYGKEASNPYLTELQQRAEDPTAFQAHSYLFLAHARRGLFDQAFAQLEKNISLKSAIILLMYSDPLAGDDIREDARYEQFHRKLYRLKEIAVPLADPKEPLLDIATREAWTARVLAFVEEAMPYLNPKLSLRELAQQVDIHPNQLSWLLNESLEKNFNTFINQYRVAHFKKLAADPRNSHISLEGLGYESGFNSKTVFYTFFKKEEGLTPNAYLKSLQ